MKKLNLKLGSIKSMLSTQEMKKIQGGGDECYANLPCGFMESVYGCVDPLCELSYREVCATSIHDAECIIDPVLCAAACWPA
jgi:hypothetical protein